MKLSENQVMHDRKSFKVAIRRKVPYLANLFLIIGGLCFLVILAFDFLFSPFKNAGFEMQAALFYWLVPELWKKVLVFSTIGFGVTAIIYALLRYYKSAMLLFSEKEIIIRGKAMKLTIPVNHIRKVFCNDARDIDGQPKKRFSITIDLKRKRKAFAIHLKNYEEVEEFMEQLMKYEGIDLSFYDFAYNPLHINEE